MPAHEFTHLLAKPGINFMMQTLFLLALSASQKRIKLHLLITIDAQGLGLGAHDLIKKTSIVFHMSKLSTNSTCIQSLLTSEQPL